MKIILIVTIIVTMLLLLTGCATTHYQIYYETAKTISKDTTLAQTACFAVVAEIVKNSDNVTKTGALVLIDKCKSNSITLDSPKVNWLGF